MKKEEFYSFFIIYKKWVEQLIIKETEVILNSIKRYFHDNIEELRERARNKYRELSEEEKDIKREYGRNRYNNMPEEDKKG